MMRCREQQELMVARHWAPKLEQRRLQRYAIVAIRRIGGKLDIASALCE